MYLPIFLKGAIDAITLKMLWSRITIFAKNWVDNFYNWDIRANQWIGMLNGIKQLKAQEKMQDKVLQKMV